MFLVFQLSDTLLSSVYIVKNRQMSLCIVDALLCFRNTLKVFGRQMMFYHKPAKQKVGQYMTLLLKIGFNQ